MTSVLYPSLLVWASLLVDDPVGFLEPCFCEKQQELNSLWSECWFDPWYDKISKFQDQSSFASAWPLKQREDWVVGRGKRRGPGSSRKGLFFSLILWSAWRFWILSTLPTLWLRDPRYRSKASEITVCRVWCKWQLISSLLTSESFQCAPVYYGIIYTNSGVLQGVPLSVEFRWNPVRVARVFNEFASFTELHDTP